MSNDTAFWLLASAAVVIAFYGINFVKPPTDNPPPADLPPSRSGLELFAQAIAFAEGYGADPGNVPTRSNNPGDLTHAGSIIQFPSADAGWSALHAQLQAIADGRSAYYDPNFTIGQIASVWTTTQQDAWAQNVTAYLQQNGVDANVDTPFLAVIA